MNKARVVDIPLEDLKRVLPFKASDDVRYRLNGVLVTLYEGHALLIATNGHWIGICESVEARTDQPRILDLPNWFVAQITDLSDDILSGDYVGGEHDHRMPLGKTWVTVETATARLIVRQDDVEVLVKPGQAFIDGEFPDWRKVLPDTSTLKPGISVPVSAIYLSSLHEAAPGDGHPLFCYQQRGAKLSPVIFRFGGIPELVIALMPRSDGEAAVGDWPKWMLPKPSKEAAA